MSTRITALPSALALLAASATASAGNVGMYGNLFDTEDAAAFTLLGHTSVANINIGASLAPYDAVWLKRFGAAPTPAEAANIMAYINAGGCVFTDFDTTNWFFDGTLASYAGTLLNNFYFPDPTFTQNSVVTVTNASNPITAGLAPSWTGQNPMQVFQAYQLATLDPAIDVAVTLFPNQPWGTALLAPIPVVGTIDIGLGHVALMFSDFADFLAPDVNPNEYTLLNNAVICIPAPGAAGAIMLGVALASARRRGR